MSLPPVIGVTGYKRSGKSTVVEMLAAWGYEQAAFATPLKKIALAVDPFVPTTMQYHGGERLSDRVDRLGWEGAKSHPEVRRFLQRLGTEGIRNHLGEDAWVRAFERSMEPGKMYAIADVRFPNEAAAVRRWGGAVCKVVRPDTDSDGHLSERSVGQINPDFLIPNLGTLDQLRIWVRVFVNRLTEQ